MTRWGFETELDRRAPPSPPNTIHLAHMRAEHFIFAEGSKMRLLSVSLVAAVAIAQGGPPVALNVCDGASVVGISVAGK